MICIHSASMKENQRIYKLLTYLLTLSSLNFSNKYIVTSNVDRNF